MKEGTLMLSLLACLAAAGLSHGREPATDSGGQIELNRATQIRSGLHHWSGPGDGSVKVRLYRSDDLLIVEAWLRDDVPFLQPRPGKLNPDWWKMEYGADGLRFILRRRTEPAQVRYDFYIEFGSYAMTPQVQVVEPESGETKLLRGSRMRFSRKADSTHFVLALPLEHLLEPPYSLKDSEMEVRLYDLDGDADEYTVLSDVVALQD